MAGLVFRPRRTPYCIDSRRSPRRPPRAVVSEAPSKQRRSALGPERPGRSALHRRWAVAYTAPRQGRPVYRVDVACIQAEAPRVNRAKLMIRLEREDSSHGIL